MWQMERHESWKKAMEIQALVWHKALLIGRNHLLSKDLFLTNGANPLATLVDYQMGGQARIDFWFFPPSGRCSFNWLFLPIMDLFLGLDIYPYWVNLLKICAGYVLGTNNSVGHGGKSGPNSIISVPEPLSRPHPKWGMGIPRGFRDPNIFF